MYIHLMTCSITEVSGCFCLSSGLRGTVEEGGPNVQQKNKVTLTRAVSAAAEMPPAWCSSCPVKKKKLQYLFSAAWRQVVIDGRNTLTAHISVVFCSFLYLYGLRRLGVESTARRR